MNEKDMDLRCLQMQTKIIYQQIGHSDLWIRVEYFFALPLKMEMRMTFKLKDNFIIPMVQVHVESLSVYHPFCLLASQSDAGYLSVT